MTDNNGIRSGSLQFYPRVRAKRVIPNVNWKPVKKEGVGILGFVGYKVGMVSVWVKDDTPESMTKGKRIAVPATVIECPNMKIYSVRFYKNGRVMRDVIVSNDKILKKRVKLPKNLGKIDDVKEYDDVRVILYSGAEKISVGKKVPDFLEIGLSGSSEEKLNFVKEKIGKEILISDFLKSGVVDVRGVTKGYGTQGPVKRFGISLKGHKSEKGVRRPGSLAPWHPARVTFRTPMAGQTGYHNRISYNHFILDSGKISERDVNKKGGFHRYGKIKTDYIILKGSVPGPAKRALVMTSAIRPTKSITKKKFETLEIR